MSDFFFTTDSIFPNSYIAIKYNLTTFPLHWFSSCGFPILVRSLLYSQAVAVCQFSKVFCLVSLWGGENEIEIRAILKTNWNNYFSFAPHCT